MRTATSRTAIQTVKLTPEVRDVLERSEITAQMVVLPGQLDRALYLEVDKVLRLAGGKWMRGAKAHKFDKDPRAVLGLALETGGIEDRKKTFQVFPTPAPLARRVVEEAGVELHDLVLEPSAGEGALAMAAAVREAAGGRGFVRCVEIRPEAAALLTGLGFEVIGTDFLAMRPEVTPAFDRVVMNPPFHGGQDIDHVRHAFKFLRKGGTLAAIMSSSMVYSSTVKCREFREFVKDNGTWEPLPADSFSSSGTHVSTVLVTLTKK